MAESRSESGRKTARRPAKAAGGAAGKGTSKAVRANPLAEKGVGKGLAPDTPRSRSQVPIMTAEMRHRMIEEAAYYRAQRRGFHAGSEQQDWLEAEREIDELLSQ